MKKNTSGREAELELLFPLDLIDIISMSKPSERYELMATELEGKSVCITFRKDEKKHINIKFTGRQGFMQKIGNRLRCHINHVVLTQDPGLGSQSVTDSNGRRHNEREAELALTELSEDTSSSMPHSVTSRQSQSPSSTPSAISAVGKQSCKGLSTKRVTRSRSRCVGSVTAADQTGSAAPCALASPASVNTCHGPEPMSPSASRDASSADPEASRHATGSKTDYQKGDPLSLMTLKSLDETPDGEAKKCLTPDSVDDSPVTESDSLLASATDRQELLGTPTSGDEEMASDRKVTIVHCKRRPQQAADHDVTKTPSLRTGIKRRRGRPLSASTIGDGLSVDITGLKSAEAEAVLTRYALRCCLCDFSTFTAASLERHAMLKHGLSKSAYHQTAQVSTLSSGDNVGEGDGSYGDSAPSDKKQIAGDAGCDAVTGGGGVKRVRNHGDSPKRKKSRKKRESSRVSCSLCEASFSRPMRLRKHILSEHGSDARIRHSLIDIHRNSRSESKSDVVTKCLRCDEEFSGARILSHVKKWHAHDTDFRSLFEATQKAYQQGRYTVYGKGSAEEKGVCHHCGSLLRKSSLANHVRLHCRMNKQRRKLYSCNKCGFSSVYEDSVEAHRQSHHVGAEAGQVPEFVCSTCGSFFVTKSGMMMHCRRKHGKVWKAPLSWFPCGTCGKKFYTMFSLERHKPVHTGEALFVCDICHKKYTDSSTLLAHTKTVHLKQFRYHCAKCGHGMEKKSYLKRHRCERVNHDGRQVSTAGGGRQVEGPSHPDDVTTPEGSLPVTTLMDSDGSRHENDVTKVATMTSLTGDVSHLGIASPTGYIQLAASDGRGPATLQAPDGNFIIVVSGDSVHGSDLLAQSQSLVLINRVVDTADKTGNHVTTRSPAMEWVVTNDNLTQVQEDIVIGDAL